MLFCFGKHILWIPKKIIFVSRANYFIRLDVILSTCESLHLNKFFQCLWILYYNSVYQVLWPNGTFFIKLESGQAKSGDVHLGQKGVPTSSKRSGVGATGSSSFEAQLEAARRASDVKKMILGERTTFPANLSSPLHMIVPLLSHSPFFLHFHALLL